MLRGYESPPTTLATRVTSCWALVQECAGGWFLNTSVRRVEKTLAKRFGRNQLRGSKGHSWLPRWLSHLSMQETQETQVRSLDWEESLEKEMAGEFHGQRGAWWAIQFMGLQRVRYDWTRTQGTFFTLKIEKLYVNSDSQQAKEKIFNIAN